MTRWSLITCLVVCRISKAKSNSELSNPHIQACFLSPPNLVPDDSSEYNYILGIDVNQKKSCRDYSLKKQSIADSCSVAQELNLKRLATTVIRAVSVEKSNSVNSVPHHNFVSGSIFICRRAQNRTMDGSVSRDTLHGYDAGSPSNHHIVPTYRNIRGWVPGFIFGIQILRGGQCI